LPSAPATGSISDLVRHCTRPVPRRRKDLQEIYAGGGGQPLQHSQSGEDMNQAVSINGQPYSSSPNAFRYRQEFNPSCACKAAGQTWFRRLEDDRR